MPRSIGFLHLDHSTGGIHRYSTMLAEAMRELPDVDVVERTAAGTTPVSARALLRAVAGLRRADVTILQYSRYHAWAPGRARLVELALIHLLLRFRAVVVIHDVSPPASVDRVETWSLRLHLLLARAVVVHGAHERARLPRRPKARRLATIPLLRERRELPDREEARSVFGLRATDQILGILGWVHPQKNHATALEALALLEPRARLWMMGAVGPGNERYAQQLMQLADRLGVRDRVELTGYLSEDELNARLAAIDVALCPYADAAASASLATLLAARTPVVANDLPAFREQERYADGLLHLVVDPTPQHLAEAVRSILDQSGTARPPDDLWADEISPPAIARQVLNVVFPGDAARDPRDGGATARGRAA